MTASPASRAGRLRRAALIAALTAAASACATTAAFRDGRRAERDLDYDQAVLDYTRALRERPHDRATRLALERARLRAAEVHYTAGRRLERQARWEDALAEYRIAAELNPTLGGLDDRIRTTREAVRTALAAPPDGRTALEALIERTRDAAPPELALPQAITLPDSVVFRDASARAIFSALGQIAGITVIFDPQFRDTTISADLRGATFETALESVTASTGHFARVTAPGTVTIIPDTPVKRREYQEEIVRTFYLSHLDLEEAIDLLRLVIDLRRLGPVTATNAISIKDTPERVAAAGRLLRAVDKARAEVVIDVQLLEVDRRTLSDYGLRFISPGVDPGAEGIETIVGVDNDLTLDELGDLGASDVFVANLPNLLVRLLERNGNTRILANPRLRTSDGLAAEAHFGERVPVPVTTFTPIAAGGLNQQPITSFNYEDIGVNIAITPRVHHDDHVSLTLDIEISNISGLGFGDLPQFGNREIVTTIRLQDGETNILAGLIRDDERETLEGIPGLNRVPVLGRMFGRTETRTQETDIVLTLRPHIIRGLDLDEHDLLPFRVGRDGTAATATSAIPPLQQRLEASPRLSAPAPLQRPVAPPPPPDPPAAR